MVRVGVRGVAALAAIMLVAPVIAAVQEPGGIVDMPILLRIEPATLPPGVDPSTIQQPVVTVPGLAVRFKGVVLPGLRGQVLRITVTPPQTRQAPDPSEAAGEIPEGCSRVMEVGPFRAEKPRVLTVTVGADAIFDTMFTPTTTGDHEVEIVDPSGRYRGEGTFSVESLQEVADGLCEQLTAEAVNLVKHAHAVFNEARARLREQPPSPGRDEAMRMADRLARELNEAFPQSRAPSWTQGAEHLARLLSIAPETGTLAAPLLRDIRAWRRNAEDANRKAPQALAALSKGNILCDNLDTIVNGLKFTDFLLSLLTTPGTFFVDWAQENVPTKLVSMLPAVRRTPAVQEGIESSWKGILTFKPWAGRSSGPAPMSNEFDEQFERQLGVQKMAFDLSAYVASRVLEAYCQQFRGPVSGTMRAYFLNADGLNWWSYLIEIKGELVLRYPKDAKGDAVGLTGEIIGNGTRFRSEDSAVPYLFPGIGTSVVYPYTVRNEPMGMGDVNVLNDSPAFQSASLAGQPLPSFNPLTSVIDKGGQVTRMLLTPAFFKIPVRGDLRGNTVRLTLQEAVQDFEDTARTRVLRLMVPVLTLGMPQVITYSLPYRGARLLLFRAFDDGPVEFTVQRRGPVMTIERVFHRERPTAETRGVYDVTVKACNPGCS